MTRAQHLCVDLDGTLSRVDTLHEQLLRSFTSWSAALGLLRHLTNGRAGIKDYLAHHVPFAPERLPYHEGLLQWLTQEKAGGRRLVLATGANQRIADAVAKHLGIFDEVLASDASTNLKGRTKAQRLAEKFGERNFAYVGNDGSDVWVWRRAASAIPVGATPGVTRAAARATTVERAFPPEGGGIGRALVRALRPRQWLKNGLVFVPIVTSRALGDTGGWIGAFLIFLSFCALASAGYIINDLSDLSADRAHALKRHRPFAAGDLSAATGIALAGLLIVLGAGLAVAAGAVIPAGVYLAGTLLYSAVLKTLSLVDVFTLGGLYTIRVVAGGVASGHRISEWLLAFSGFLFVSLACMKRVAELRAHSTAEDGAKRRPYTDDDLRFLEMLGIGCSVASAVVLALYAKWQTGDITATERLSLLWSVSPVMLFWQMRLWLSTFRGYMLEDPLAYASKDWVTRLAGVLVGVLFLLSGR